MGESGLKMSKNLCLINESTGTFDHLRSFSRLLVLQFGGVLDRFCVQGISSG